MLPVKEDFSFEEDIDKDDKMQEDIPP